MKYISCVVLFCIVTLRLQHTSWYCLELHGNYIVMYCSLAHCIVLYGVVLYYVVMHGIALDLVRLCFAALYRYRIMLFLLFHSLRCEMPQKEQVRMNLVSSLAAAQITFLSGIESTDNQVQVCL